MTNHPRSPITPPAFNRRKWLVGGGLTAAALVGAGLVRNWYREKAAVFIAKDQRYDQGARLIQTIQDGLTACGFVPESVRGKRVLLKPNLVEPMRERPHMTTHPALHGAHE